MALMTLEEFTSEYKGTVQGDRVLALWAEVHKRWPEMRFEKWSLSGGRSTSTSDIRRGEGLLIVRDWRGYSSIEYAGAPPSVTSGVPTLEEACDRALRHLKSKRDRINALIEALEPKNVLD
jgi:hypothetical protein